LKRVAKIWEDAFDRKPLGIDDDFFALGGNSLLAVSIFSKIENQFNRKLAPSALVQNPTIAQLAAWLDQQTEKKSKPNLSNTCRK
jgi:acyl carrier protein